MRISDWSSDVCSSDLAQADRTRGDIQGLVAGRSLRSIAAQLGRAPSTISREIGRNGRRDRYRGTVAAQAAWDRALPPKPCKRAGHRADDRREGKGWVMTV